MSPLVPTKEATVTFSRGGETYQTWYKVVGNLATCAQTPLVVLHGGPAQPHDYLIPISDLAVSASVPVVFYDQLGCGRSTRLSGKPPSFWTFDLFIDELVNLLTHLSIASDFSVLGHSWGGVLAAEFVVRRHPVGMRRLILSNSMPSIDLWRRSLKLLREQLPRDEQEAMAAGPEVDEGKYWEAMRHFQDLHDCVLQPCPEELEYSRTQAREDQTVINGLAQGEYDESWTIVDRLHRIHVPTLVINGRVDFVQDLACKPFFDRIQKVRWITFERSGHTPFWEERSRYIQVIADFLRL